MCLYTRPWVPSKSVPQYRLLTELSPPVERWFFVSNYSVMARAALPIACAAAGALLGIISPLSHQAFCSPLTVPVILAPEGSSVVPGES